MRRAGVALFLAGGLLLGLTRSAVAGDLTRMPSPEVGAPIEFARDFPDPSILSTDDGYYAYATRTAWQAGVFPILHSNDLIHWTYQGDAMGTAPAWAADDLWAPAVIGRDGIYFLYYSALSEGSRHHCLAVATSSSPLGPFADQDVLACGDATGRGYIDPSPFLAADGSGYLYFSVDEPYHSISVLPLAADLLHASGPRVELFGVSQAWERGSARSTVEGPSVVERSGTLYLFYAGNDWRSDYGTGVATGRSPLGPFSKAPSNPLRVGGADLRGSGGASVFDDPSGALYLAYHSWTAEGRVLSVSPLLVDGPSVGTGGYLKPWHRGRTHSRF